MRQLPDINEVNTSFGKIVFSEELLADLAGHAAYECCGLAGMSSISLRDGLSVLLKRENLSRGIKVHFVDNQLIFDLNIIVTYGSRIREVAADVMNKVKYTIEKVTGIQVAAVNINVQGIQAATAKQ